MKQKNIDKLKLIVKELLTDYERLNARLDDVEGLINIIVNLEYGMHPRDKAQVIINYIKGE